MTIKGLFLFLITAGNFWLTTHYPNLYLKLEALGARKRTHSYLLSISSYSVPKNLLQKKPADVEFRPIVTGKVNRTFMEKLPSYGSNEFIFKSLGVDFIHSKGLYGQDIVVGVFDTGFDSTHPAINSIYAEGRVVAQYDFNSGDHLILNGNEVSLSDSAVYINGYSIKDTFMTVSYVPIDILALNDNAYRIILIHGEIREMLSVNQRGIKPRLLIKQDTVYVVYEGISGGYMQVYLARRTPDGTLKRISITDSPVDNIWPDISGKNDSIFIYYANPYGILRATLLGDSIIKTDTLLKKQNLTYLRVYDDKYLIYSTYDSIGVAEISSLTGYDIFARKGFNPGLNPVTRTLYFSDCKGTWLYDLNKETIEFVTSMILTSPPQFYNDSSMLATFNDYAAYKIIYKRLHRIYTGLCDLIDGDGTNFLIRQRGDNNVMPDTKDAYNMHGTEMLSLIGGFWEGKITGIAPLANFILCKTERGTSPHGTDFENPVEEDFWVEALEFAINNGVKIVSSSLGYSDWYSKSQLDGKYPVSSRMASKALSMGVLLLNAMGNDTHPSIPEKGDTSLVAPADAYGIISVGGCDSTCEKPADCSYGPTGDGRIKPELVAPFNAYWADSEGTIYRLEGTSVSTAISAGILAALWSSDTGMSADFIRTLALHNATQLSGYTTPNNITGYGKIDAVKIYNALSPEKESEGDVAFLSPYPNPVRKSEHKEITIPLQFVHRGDGMIKVLTANGKVVKTLTFYNRGPGILTFSLPVQNLSPGLYTVFCHTTFKSARTRFVILP